MTGVWEASPAAPTRGGQRRDSDREELDIKKMTGVWEASPAAPTRGGPASSSRPPRSIGETAAARGAPTRGGAASSSRPPRSIGETAAARAAPTRGGPASSSRPPRSIDETAAARVSLASSPAHSKALSSGCSKVWTKRAAACDATDPKPEPEVVSRASQAVSPGCSKVSSSCAAACDATNPKPEPEVEGSAGRNTEMLVSLSVGPSVDKLQSRIDSANSSAIPENIRLQKTRPPSQLQTGGADSDWRDAQVSGKKNEVSDHQYWQTDTVSSHISLVQEANQESRRSIHKIAQTRSSQNCYQRVSEKDANNGCRFPEVSKEDKLARDSKLELIDAFEAGNRSEQLKKPLAMSPREPIRFHFFFFERSSGFIYPGDLLCWITELAPQIVYLQHAGALDAIGEPRLPQEHIVPSVLTWEGENYITTLGPGGGYGYPHPPPFYKCEVCRDETAFYRLKCCHTVVCEFCGCTCEFAEAGKDKRLQYLKEKLPPVKLEGSDLFLWQPCSFPDKQMLLMAKRAENHLQYYFGPIDHIMDPEADTVEVCVYDFCLQGCDVIALSKTKQSLERNLLC